MQKKHVGFALLAVAVIVGGVFLFIARPHEVLVYGDGKNPANTTTTPHTPGATKPTSTPTKPVQTSTDTPDTPTPPQPTQPYHPVPMDANFDTAAYDAKLLSIANLLVITKTRKVTSTLPGSSTIITKTITTTSTVVNGWPVKAPYPKAGAIFPFNRVVAYYGNLYSKQMGVLGEYPSTQMLAMLTSTTAMWAAADPSTPVIPALHYIATTAQASAGADGKYRLRMPDDQIDKVLAMAAQINALVFLDFQVGLSNVQSEIPLYEKYFKMPQVHLGLDPEFDMPGKQRPGTIIGTMSAADINWAAEYLAKLVQENNLPPKALVIHRFTEDMVTNYKQIKPLAEVQIVMDMDGFGFPAKKIGTYQQVIVPEPVQFTGFKLFYKNDAAGPQGHLMTPKEVLKLSPQPSYIQYQ